MQRVLVERAARIEREFYLSLIVDRDAQRIVVVASAEGGVDIEEVARDHPEAIHTEESTPASGCSISSAARSRRAIGLGRSRRAVHPACSSRMYRLFRDKDCLLLEINPFIVTDDGDMLALDCKMTFDDNALFRQGEVAELRDFDEEDPKEVDAAGHGINYVALDGSVGCIVNGAGLSMATMDAIAFAGGRAANFLDVGGGASPDKVANAFRIVLKDANVRAILVNIFAGINRCDWIAQGSCRPRGAGVRRPGDRAARGHQRGGRHAVLDECGLSLIQAEIWTMPRPRPSARRARRCRHERVRRPQVAGHHPGLHRPARHVPCRGGHVAGTKSWAASRRERAARPIWDCRSSTASPEAVAETGADVSGIFVPPDGRRLAARGRRSRASTSPSSSPTACRCRTWSHKRYLAGRPRGSSGRTPPASSRPASARWASCLATSTSKGRVGVVSRSGTLNYEAVPRCRARSGPVHLRGHRRRPGQRHGLQDGPSGVRERRRHRCRRHDRRDRREAGGGCRGVGGANMTKPLVAFIAGVSAPRGRRMGHAGAVISGDADTAAAKLDAIESHGHRVVRNPAEIGDMVLRTVKETGERVGTGAS